MCYWVFKYYIHLVITVGYKGLTDRSIQSSNPVLNIDSPQFTGLDLKFFHPTVV